jgi:hypothetical protein
LRPKLNQFLVDRMLGGRCSENLGLLHFMLCAWRSRGRGRRRLRRFRQGNCRREEDEEEEKKAAQHERSSTHAAGGERPRTAKAEGGALWGWYTD